MTEKIRTREEVLPDWYATFKDLRLASVTLKEWLEFHQKRKLESK